MLAKISKRKKVLPDAQALHLKLILPPPEVKDPEECDRTYTIADAYRVCINADTRKYYVWDLVAEVPEYLALVPQAERLLIELLHDENLSPSDILKRLPDPLDPIANRQFHGYGRLEPFLKDPEIIDVHIVLGQPVQVIHRSYGKLETNILPDDQEVIELALKMANQAGKNLSEARPLASFIEPLFNSRVTIVYNSDITMRRGMTVDIRRQPEKPWTMLKLIDLGTFTIEEAVWLWQMLLHRAAIIIHGELASGKTTVSTALLNLLPEDTRIITIEDAPELRLHVKYWTRTTTRDSDVNPITVFDLLKVAMRITPDYIIVGEVRGAEARDWAQGILLGHGALTTFHADSPQSVLLRLKTPPIEVNPQALEHLNILVRMIPIRARRGLVRRSEVWVHDRGPSGEYELFPVFKYDPERDVIERVVDDLFKFPFINRVAVAQGVTREMMRRDYERMVEVMRRVYEMAKEKEGNDDLEWPDYRELPRLLYSMLGGE